MRLLDRLTTKHKFRDGSTLSFLHKYALRYQAGDRSAAVGFEQAFEPGVDRLIHESSILTWMGPRGDMAVTPAERADILAKVEEYCRVKALTYRVVRGEASPVGPTTK